MILKNITIGLVLLVAVSLVSAFGINSLSSNGIALFGKWDTSKGTISANSKQDLSYIHDLEIRDVQAVKKIFDKGDALFVDARVKEDFTDGHIKGAVSLPINQFDENIEDFLSKYQFSKHIVTYCSGRECEDSHRLAEKLINIGYTEVKIFIDGYPVWEEKGYPVEK